MKNLFYHELVLSFNWWYVVLPIMIATMLMIGASRFSLSGKSLRIRKKKNSCLYLRILAAMLDAVICFLIMCESIIGILQAIVNHLEDIMWLPFVAAVAILGMVIVLYYTLYGAGRIGMWIAHGYLCELRSIKKAERRRQFYAPVIEPEESRFERLRDEDVEVFAPQH